MLARMQRQPAALSPKSSARKREAFRPGGGRAQPILGASAACSRRTRSVPAPTSTACEDEMETTRNTRVKPVVSLEEFFRNSVANAMHRQGISADDHTAYYVVNLLTLYARSEVLHEGSEEGRTLKPLALILAEAMDARTTEERNIALQRIG